MGPALAAAAAVSWVLAVRILYGRWNDRIRDTVNCSCGSRCEGCLMSPYQVMVWSLLAALVWPLLAVAAFAQWRQPATITQRLAMLRAERQRLAAAAEAAGTERQRFEEATEAMRAARAAWITEAEIDTGLAASEDQPA